MHQSLYFLFHAMPHDEIDNCSLKEQLEAAQTPHLRFKKPTKQTLVGCLIPGLSGPRAPRYVGVYCNDVNISTTKLIYPP